MSPKRKISNINDEFDFKLFILIYRKNFHWILLFLFIAISSGTLYIRYTQPIYESNIVIKLGTENKASAFLSYSAIEQINPWVELQGNVELLKSRIVLSKAIKSLPLRESYFSQGSVLFNELYRTSPFSVQYEIADSSILDVPIYISFGSQGRYSLSYHNTINIPGLKTNEWSSVPFGRLKVEINDISKLNSKEFSGKKDVFFFTINNIETVISRFMSLVNVQVLSGDAQTIGMKLQDKNPLKTSDILNAMANAFLRFDLERKEESFNKVLNFINNLKGKVEEDLRLSENNLENFKVENKIINPEAGASAILNRLYELENKQIDLNLQLGVAEKMEDHIATAKNFSSILSILTGSKTEGIIYNLVNLIQQLQNEKDQLLFQVTPESNQIKNLNKKIESNKSLLFESISGLKQSIIDNQNSLEKRMKEFETNFVVLPHQDAEFTRLKRIYNISEKFFYLLLEKTTEFDIKKEGLTSSTLILQPAFTPTTPVSPNRTLVMGASIILGSLAGFIIIVMNYLFHNVITSLEEVELYTEAALLGMVPKYKNPIPVSMLIVDKNPKSIISEAFRSIRTNLQFISNEPGSKTAVITSTISGEGKTFVAINLAGVLSFSGKKVILLDLDMRKPKIHLGFNAPNNKGMSTLLIEKDRLEDCIQKSSLENLHFITAGPIPPNPAELIISKNMQELLKHLKSIYDIIIIDTPPVGILSDGITMLQEADYPIYILRSHVSKKMFIKNINKMMDENKINRMSLILNGALLMKSKYGYGYTYAYGYGYGYGYGGYGYGGYGYGGYGYGYYDEDKKKDEKRSLITRIFKPKT